MVLATQHAEGRREAEEGCHEIKEKVAKHIIDLIK